MRWQPKTTTEVKANKGAVRFLVGHKVPDALRSQLGISIARRTNKAARGLLSSPRWQRVYNAGARPQCLLLAITWTKDPLAPDVLYVKELAAPFTVNTMPENTLKARPYGGDRVEELHDQESCQGS
jgi:transaldolase